MAKSMLKQHLFQKEPPRKIITVDGVILMQVVRLEKSETICQAMR